MAAGAADLGRIAVSANDEAKLRAMWNEAIIRTMYLAVAFTASAVPFTLAMQWLNATRGAQERQTGAWNGGKKGNRMIKGRNDALESSKGVVPPVET